MKPTLNTISYGTAIGLAALSGAIATYGLTKFVPGSEIPVAVMGGLFECAKLSSLALLHRKALPRRLKLGLAAISLTLMTANVAGVSGFLSNAYEHQQIGARATAHTAAANAYASAELAERQLAAAESNLAAARTALIRAKDDKARARAAQAIITTATAERDTLVQKLAAARSAKAMAGGDAINATSEFAAIQFIAGATGSSADAVARIAILTISSIPDIAAALLLWAAACATKTKARVRTSRKPAPRRKHIRQPAALKVVPNAQTAN